MSDKWAFIGDDRDGSEYCVFTLGDTHEVSFGDHLSGDFHGHSASTFTARNLTKGDNLMIDLRDWELPLALAVVRLMSIEPATKFIVGNKVFMAHLDDVFGQLCNEIRRA